MSAEPLLSRLEGARKTGPDRWVARCPAHEDRSPSLSVRELTDGRILVHCFGGCSVGDILAAVGLELDALFPPRPNDSMRRPRERQPFTAADALRCLSFEADFLAVCASDLAQGRPLSEETRQRLLIAAARIGTAKVLCHA